MNPRARHWTAFLILAVCTFFSGASFVTYKASVLAQAPFAAGESTWFISFELMDLFMRILGSIIKA